MISVIVPVLNEESTIDSFLYHFYQVSSPHVELIVVDGGSTDATKDILKKYPAKCLHTEKGRAKQMNHGALQAYGDVFLFLHADSLLPKNWESDIINCVYTNPWGFFKTSLTGDRLSYRIIETFMNIRSCFTGIATGDKGIFIERKFFRDIGGFPEIPIMEDIAVSLKLKKISKYCCIRSKIITSSRKWEREGVIHTILLMWKMRFLYFLGYTPDKLIQMYYGKK